MAKQGNRIDSLLSTMFLDIDKSPVAFKSAAAVHEYLREELGIRNVPLSVVRRFEAEKVRPNQVIHDVRNGRKETLSYVAKGLDSLWQVDLVDLHKKNNSPNAYAFALVKIDVFSRKADAELVIKKLAIKVTQAFDKICRRNGRWPDTLQTDEGKEFLNSSFQKYCESKKIRHFVVNSEKKAAVVERFNRDFQKLLYRFKQAYPKRTIKELIAKVVVNHNDSRHSHHCFKPSDINVALAAKMVKLQHRDRMRKGRMNRARVRPSRFDVGDTVRTVATKTPFDKSYRGLLLKRYFRSRKDFANFPITTSIFIV